MNPLYNQLNPPSNNPMLKQLMQFRKGFNGNPQQMVQQMLNSGKISQTQLNQYAQQANQIYNQFKDFM
jgi:hypothetical protein